MWQTILRGGDDLLTASSIFVLAAALVWWAGARLAGYADRFSRLTGLSGAVTGLVLLGGITSLPEIATSATAALSGQGKLAAASMVLLGVLSCVSVMLTRWGPKQPVAVVKPALS